MTEKIEFSTVEQILGDILKTLSTEYQEKIKEMSLIDFEVQEHFNLRLLIRNKYFYQNKAQKEIIKNLGGEEDFLFLDGDEFSGIILEKLYERITTEKK